MQSEMASTKSAVTLTVLLVILCQTKEASGYNLPDDEKPMASVIGLREPNGQIILLDNNGPVGEMVITSDDLNTGGGDNYEGPSSAELAFINQQLRAKKSAHKGQDRLMGRRAAYGSACLFKLCPHIY